VASDSQNLTIRIHPVSFPGIDRNEQVTRAIAIAEDLNKIEGFASVKVQRSLYEKGVITNAVDPTIAVEITETTGPLVSDLLKLLREKRAKKDHRATIIFIENTAHLVTNENEPKERVKIEKQIERYFRKAKKKL
jgi:hypothetical protein